MNYKNSENFLYLINKTNPDTNEQKTVNSLIMGFNLKIANPIQTVNLGKIPNQGVASNTRCPEDSI